jgi:prepilin-type N-terminal cleavage/methylation domain-containing protein
MSSLQICCCKIACPRGKRDSIVSRGFSLLELIIVIGISIIIAAIAIPSFLTAHSNLQLRSAASDLSGFMQRTRMQAAKQNATYTIGYRSITNVNEAYIDLNNNGQWDVGEPQLTFSSVVSPAAGAPSGVGGAPVIYQDVVPIGDARLMGGA